MIPEKEFLTPGEHEDLEQALKRNTNEFTTLKLIEELAELQEKLIKYHLKSPSHKPKLEEILDEIGDVQLRIELFIDKVRNEDFDVDDYLDERIDRKLMKLHGYVKEGKYKGGL